MCCMYCAFLIHTFNLCETLLDAYTAALWKIQFIWLLCCNCVPIHALGNAHAKRITSSTAEACQAVSNAIEIYLCDSVATQAFLMVYDECWEISN